VTESRQAGRSPGPGENLQKWLVSLPPTLFLLAFLVAPALLMVVASFQQVGDFGGLVPVLENGQSTLSLEAYRFFFGDWIYAEIFLRSFLVATATTLLCLLLAYPLALLIATGGKRHRDLLVLLVILPLASNFLIRIYAWMIVLGPAELLYTPFAVIVGMVYVHLPFMILPLYTNLESHDPALLEAAQDLGAGAWTRFWRITLPLSLPGVWSGSALVFIPVLGMFAIPELLGGTRDILIGNLIKEQFLDNRDWPLGSTLSILLTAAVLLLAWLAAWAGRPRRGGRDDPRRSPVRPLDRGPGGLRLSLFAAGGRRDLLVQRLAAQCRMGWLYHALVRATLRKYGDAARGGQFADHRSRRGDAGDGARQHGRHCAAALAVGLPACFAVSGPGAGGDARDPAWRFAAAFLPPGARSDARPGVDPDRAHHLLDRFCRDHRPRSSCGPG
jgi:spermidine/putrescine transport system permease protein